MTCSDCGVVIGAMNAARRRHGLNGHGFRATAVAILRNLHARHQEYDVAACLAVVRNKEAWLDDGRMAEYFRPSTLFRPSHFEEYLVATARPARSPDQRSETDPWGRCALCGQYGHGGSDCPRRCIA